VNATCTICGTPIPAHTKAGRPRKTCSAACAEIKNKRDTRAAQKAKKGQSCDR